MKNRFLEHFQKSSESLAAQDALIEFYEETAMIGGGYTLSDAEVRATFENITNDDKLSSVEKDAYLSALDVAVQNHHPAGMAADILTEIHAAQSEYVLNGDQNV